MQNTTPFHVMENMSLQAQIVHEQIQYLVAAATEAIYRHFHVCYMLITGI